MTRLVDESTKQLQEPSKNPYQTTGHACMDARGMHAPGGDDVAVDAIREKGEVSVPLRLRYGPSVYKAKLVVDVSATTVVASIVAVT